MSNFTAIQHKLKGFISRYYENELIKGLILFSSFGLLYFIITLFIEYFFWLPPKARIILFFAFILVEMVLLIKFIAIPISKLFGFQKGISLSQASKIIGRHFPEIDDKLLNVLQLSKKSDQSELLMASIEQKSILLRPVIFKRAIDFRSNLKYLKYLLIPLLIWIATFLSGNSSIFNESLNRVVHYQTAYEPPAPFKFRIINDDLTIVEGGSLGLMVETVGDLVPENAHIHYNKENYLLKEQNQGLFVFDFKNVKENLIFYLEGNGVTSKNYEIIVIKTPMVIGFEMFLNYPLYTGKKDEIIKNTGYGIVPEGTVVTWNINTLETDSLKFISNKTYPFVQESKGRFSLKKQIKQSVNYQITTSNEKLDDYEKLNYTIEVIKDEYPKIEVKSDIDSISRGPVQFAGQLIDDYGLTKLNLVYYNSEEKDSVMRHFIEIRQSTFDEFYYIFSPAKLGIKEGVAYELYFEIFDNDAINGSKSVKSEIFYYYNKTKQEITDELLREQQKNLEDFNKTSKSSEKLSEDYDEFSKKLKNKSDINWNDRKELDQFLKRQEQYQKMIEDQTEKLKTNLEEQELNSEEKSINQRKEELKERIEEAQELQKKNDILEQLKKMSEKLDKEGMLEKLEKITQENRQKKKTLERLLEMTKRFFVEKKAIQISHKLDTLAEKQNKLPSLNHNETKEQKKLNSEFEEIEKDFKQLQKENQNLFQPMDFPDTRSDQEGIKNAMKKATEALEKQDSEQGEKNQSEDNNGDKKASLPFQKSAAVKMKQLSQKMNGAMEAMQGESISENIDDLRAIVENLLTFSFDQEELMISMENVDAAHAEFPVKLKNQQLLKEYFEHIDDSLYTLSLRLQKMSTNIQKHLTEAHYNLDRSLVNIAENKIREGRSNQQYTMTAANNLADMLGNLLNSLQNPGTGSGEGDPKDGMPDIIKKQKGLSKQLQEGIQKGKQNGGKEQMSGEQYRIYQEQNMLRQALKEMMGSKGSKDVQGENALKKMEELEKILLDKGFTNEVLQQMLRLEHELLKLEKATLEEGRDNKRESNTGRDLRLSKDLPKIKGGKLYFSTMEILDREPLLLKINYKKKVQEYFKEQ